jgi:AraC-like DNA-binding protein
MSQPGGGSKAREMIEFRRAAALDGVRVLSVRNSLHRWTLFHEAYAFTSVHGGHGAWRYGRRDRDIRPGTMMLIEPGNVHVTTDVAAPASFETVFVDVGVLANLAERCGLPGGMPHFTAADSGDPALLQAFGAVHEALRDGQAETLQQGEAFTEALFWLFRSACETGVGEPNVERGKILRVRDLLHARSRDGDAAAISVGELAATVGLSPMQLIRGFKLLFGLPPYQYLVRLRLARAQRLIERGPTDELRSLADIAQEVGFFDLPHMDRHFHRMLRLSPRRYALDLHVHGRWSGARRRD